VAQESARAASATMELLRLNPPGRSRFIRNSAMSPARAGASLKKSSSYFNRQKIFKIGQA
jgi:hypothetical protein